MKSVAFRVDSGLEIGNGHLMRCLTLADALIKESVSCYFLTRPHAGHSLSTLRNRNLTVLELPAERSGYGDHDNPPLHSTWLGGSWSLDAKECRKYLEAIAPNWLVVDHYALDQEWEAAALPAGVGLAVIDDLADRNHLSQVLVDQNLGRVESDYRGLVPESCSVFTGPMYSLLRPEFSESRDAAQKRRIGGKIRNLLITLGGVDKDNLSAEILRVLEKLDFAKYLSIEIIVGGNSPWIEVLQRMAKESNLTVNVQTGVSNMAKLMTEADVCIGASGSTSWERAVLGLPTLIVVLARNQEGAACALVDSGCAIRLPSPVSPNFLSVLLEGMTRLSDSEAYGQMARKCEGLTDGYGTSRIVNALRERSL